MEYIKIIRTIVYAVLLQCTVLLGRASIECLSNCDCLKYGGNMRLQCDRRNIFFFPLASALPLKITMINYENNKIKQLPKQPRGFTRTEVWSITLAGNVIDILLKDNLGKTFPNVSYLDLSNNKISSLSENSFQHLTNLEALYLSSNKLKTIKQGWFSPLLQLSYLNLINNEISAIEQTTNIWPELLSRLYLSYNKLKTIPKLPDNASQVDLLGNPIFCGCYLNVNKNIRKTFINVECHRLDYYQENVTNSVRLNAEYTGTKFVKSQIKEEKCQQAYIINFSYLLFKEIVRLKCITSYGYPKPSVTVYYQNKEVTKGRNNVTLNVTESGEYSCKITNYISSDQKQLVIPELSSLFTLPTDLSESEVNETIPDGIGLTTGHHTGCLETTLPGTNRKADTEELKGMTTRIQCAVFQ